jgi:hypothetical protein
MNSFIEAQVIVPLFFIFTDFYISTMKKAVLLSALLCGLNFFASAQDCGTDFLGTKTLYRNSGQGNAPAPAGYVPVFIDHVGRHGARHLTKDVSSTSACALLLEADSAGALTGAGKRLRQMVNKLQKIEKGNTKSISGEGVDELKALGERMYANYPDVFEGLPVLRVAVTKEVRTRQSADAFLLGLCTKLKDTAAISFYYDDTNLRFYDLSPAYKRFEDGVNKSELILSLEKTEHLDEINTDVTGKIFTADFLSKRDDGQRAKFVSDVFGFATIVHSLGKEVEQLGFTRNELDFESFFTCDELQKLALLDGADEYLKKGPGVNNDGIQVRIAAPLLADFISSADECLSTGKYNTRLRFAHAETIAPFAALMQISNADKAATDLVNLNSTWKASEVIPLSSNIQWVFYKKKHAAYLVKIMFNEKESRIDGLSQATYPYYKWSDLRNLYISKLKKLSIKPGDDMGKYLSDIQ